MNDEANLFPYRTYRTSVSREISKFNFIKVFQGLHRRHVTLFSSRTIAGRSFSFSLLEICKNSNFVCKEHRDEIKLPDSVVKDQQQIVEQIMQKKKKKNSPVDFTVREIYFSNISRDTVVPIEILEQFISLTVKSALHFFRIS